jgi:hypothetical protein
MRFSLTLGIVLLFATGVQPIVASSGISSNNQLAFTFPSPPFCGLLGGVIEIPIKNTGATPLSGVVFGVFHNSIGQPLEIASGAFFNITAAQNSTVNIVSTLSSGNYSTNIFVWSFNGSSIS